MNARLANQIFTRCPIIYRYRNLGPKSSLMYFGFECGDGWYQLIYDLSVAIEQEAEHLKEKGIEDSLLPAVSQVKEKFGGLRFYVHNLYDSFEKLIDDAEHKSFQICELCANPGKLRRTGSGWMVTLCNSCTSSNSRR